MLIAEAAVLRKLAFGGNSIMKCVNNLSFAENNKDPKVLIVGTSNSIIKNGWFESFYERYNKEFNIINLSLGACTSVYISYQISLNKRLFMEADIILLEPIVNDISYLPNKQISEDILFTSIEHIYSFIGSLGKPCFTLLLPTLKRTEFYYKNKVYLEHMKNAKKFRVYWIDLHPLFSKEINEIEQLFLDPGHINLDLAYHLGIEIGQILKAPLLEEAPSKKTLPVKYEILCFKDEGLIVKTSSKYSATLKEVQTGFKVDIPQGYRLAGILHWNNKNQIKVNLKTENKVVDIELKGKYLKLTSPSELIEDSFTIDILNSETILLSSFLLELKSSLIGGEVYAAAAEVPYTQKIIDTTLSSFFYKYLNYYKGIDIKSTEPYIWVNDRNNIKDILICKRLLNALESTGKLNATLEPLRKVLNEEIDRFWGS